MYDSPDLLENICVAYISKNINAIFGEVKEEYENTTESDFKTSLIRLSPILSQKLLSALDENGLADQVLTIFDPLITRLEKVYIQDASNVTAKGFRILCSHKITELVAMKLNSITVTELIGYLGDWTLENLTVLNVSGCAFLGPKGALVIALSKLRNLKHLDVSFSEFNDQTLEIISANLPVLERLNISKTMVSTIFPLKKCKDRLKFLEMFKLRRIRLSNCLTVLSELNYLLHLDISYISDEAHSAEDNLALSEFFKAPSCLPLLTSLDISGRHMDADTLEIFLENHPQIEFLGLFGTAVSNADRLTEPTHPKFNKKLISTGYGTLNQVLESLQRYMNRELCVDICLHNLLYHIVDISDVRLDILKLILHCMKSWPHHSEFQMLAVGCSYHLTKENRCDKIHASWLKQVVDLTLIAMQNFPGYKDLELFSLMTLSNDRMLLDVSFNGYLCAELVMNSLRTFDDPEMNTMSMRIFSIVSEKISAAEISSLDAIEAYMRKLLEIVKESEFHSLNNDALSALWSLTDECPRTCSILLNLGCIKIFLGVINDFPALNSASIALSILNNIAEVSHLKPSLMTEDFIIGIIHLLDCDFAILNFFASGIIANLASEGIEFWTCSCISWEEIILKLGDAVSIWKENIDEVLVTYRSFIPLYRLLSCLKAHQVQLWAAWAIYAVCFENPKHYSHLLIKEGGVDILKNLMDHSDTHPSVADVCKEILHIVERQHCSHICGDS